MRGFPALAGVASRYAELNGGLTYLAGLWEEHLPLSLGWHKYECNEPRPLEQVAPTWSWASLPRGKNLDMSTEDGYMRLLERRINPPGADVYMSAKRIEVTIEAPMLDVEVYKESDGILMGKHEEAFLQPFEDFKTDPDDPSKYRAVPDGSRCQLLLLPHSESPEWDRIDGIVLQQQTGGVDGEAAKFERIGWFHSEHMHNYFKHGLSIFLTLSIPRGRRRAVEIRPFDVADV
ncbi:hypothetical protein SLS63_010311 [Diaporthe eres]|uniref:Uncharacterized protein n=1 Tax=Diaporthe eres TaxID=83184 RepID=A0ABR1NX71_DIAER